ATDTLPIFLSNPFIQQLKAQLAALERDQAKLSERLGDRHPDMLRVRSEIERVNEQLQGEISKVAESVRNQAVGMQAKERSLSDALQTQERRAIALNRRAIEYGTLQREAASNRQIFDTLLERAKQTAISSELNITNIQIVDPAEVPQSPASPQRRLVFLLALLLGVPLAVGTVVCVDYLDDRIKSPDDIKTSLGVRCLGFAPAISRKNIGRGSVPLVGDGAPPEFSEALRTVRTNLLMRATSKGTTSLLVTSTGPGEGKTMVAT